ncbi:MAG: DUF1330 domain-containing protein [Marinobacter sp.]|uniref:DUF1330 domain-containing protein n=1 Tax=Marinobacter sp. TaxID=50741 RepID=UPI0034A041DE
MAAYLVGHIRVKQPALWQKYVSGVGNSLAGHDAEVVFRGRLQKVLAGHDERDQVVIIRFADHTALDNWFDSPGYQSLIAVRDQAADVVITSYEE